MKAALAPLEDRIASVEKARGVSRQLDGKAESIAKEDHPFSGVQI